LTLVANPVKRLLDTLTAQRRLRLYVWLSLATQILIVVTGGLVRLTGSGLGCPTWPKCTDESLISTAEMGIHGVIEFGNRLLTFVLLIVALLTFATIMRASESRAQLTRITFGFFGFVALFIVGLVFAVRAIDFTSISILTTSAVGMLGMALVFVLQARKIQRKGLLVPSFGLGFGIILQAIVGGITVLTQLNSWIVGLHFVISSGLIALASLLVFRALPKPLQEVSQVSSALRWPTVAVSAITILIGVLVTGAGPHAGDATTPRNGLNLEIWQHYHSYPGYLMLGLVFLQWFSQWRHSSSVFGKLPSRLLSIFLLVTAAQAVIGIAQARLGVPEFLVALHMLGAAALSSLVAFQFLILRKTK
jgi:cytochrome c oxidase assembly protein subunit 15